MLPAFGGDATTGAAYYFESTCQSQPAAVSSASGLDLPSFFDNG
ncbi:hypothetical protein RCH10_002380 [Variovorax sp. GrIS 2.14]